MVLFLISPPPSLAKEIMALGDPQQASAFLDHVTQSTEITSWNDHLIKTEISLNDRIIQDKYELAVKGLLLSDLNPSIYLFKEITSFKDSHLFSASTKDFLSQSYLRLANLDRNHQSFWIKQALIYNKDYKPSEDIFNPHIVSSLKYTKENLEPYFQNFSFKKENEILFLNGSRLKESSSLHPSSLYQITAYKPGYQVHKDILSGAELLKKDALHFKRLSLGSCNHPVFPNGKKLKRIDSIFYSKNCIKRRKEIDITPAAPVLSSLPQSSSQETPYSPSPSQKWYKKKKMWYIVGVGLLTSAIIIYAQQQSSNNDVQIQPVHYR